MTSPPSIPPRPARISPESESEPEPEPPTTTTTIAIPAIPPRPKRSKSPLPDPDTESDSTPSRVPVRPPVRKNTGIPQIGSRVPMYPNAGDVQAPAPASTPGGTRKAHVYREEWEMDEGAYGSKGSPRINPYTLSSNDLNQSVAQGESAPEAAPIPDEEIGYLASEHFARVISPQHTGTPTEEQEAVLSRIISHSSTPADDKPKVAIHLDPPSHHHHLHNHHPHRVPSSHPGTRPSTRPASPTKHHDHDHDHEEEGDGNNTETEREREHEYPILASDEVQKRAGQGFQLPAVSPPLAAWRPNSRPQSVHPGSLDSEDDDVEPARLSGHGSESRESLVMSSLESGERPEPLFPDSDPEDQPTGIETPAENKPHEKLKRPGLPESVGSSGHRFPSKDVWEEAPEFSQLEATVHTRPPSEIEIADEERTPKRADGPAEVPYIQGQPTEHYVPGDEVEFERKQKDSLKKPAQYQHHVDSSNRDDGLDRLLKRGNSADDLDKGASSRVKPQRFPSNDIWEDVPPSLQLSASIGEEDAATELAATELTITDGSTDPVEPEEKRPSAPIEAPTTVSKPEPPARPTARPPPKARQPSDTPQEKKPPPAPPHRPKPKVPQSRPGRPATGRSSSTDAPPPAAKPKPAVPPRTGGKIAALKAGFLSDLDNRLKLGPTAPKKEESEKEPEKEKAVLDDVRKSRAKGPRGRKLPTTTEKDLEKVETPQVLSLGVWAVWTVGGKGEVEVLDPSVKETDDVSEEVLSSSLPVTETQSVQPSTNTKAEALEDEQKLPILAPSEEHPGDALPAQDKHLLAEIARDDAADVDLVHGDVVNTEGDARVDV